MNNSGLAINVIGLAIFGSLLLSMQYVKIRQLKQDKKYSQDVYLQATKRKNYLLTLVLFIIFLVSTLFSMYKRVDSSVFFPILLAVLIGIVTYARVINSYAQKK